MAAGTHLGRTPQPAFRYGDTLMTSISPALNSATHGPHVPGHRTGHTPSPPAPAPATASAKAPAAGKRVDIAA